jgi:hypothetical protein
MIWAGAKREKSVCLASCALLMHWIEFGFGFGFAVLVFPTRPQSASRVRRFKFVIQNFTHTVSFSIHSRLSPCLLA